MRRTRCAQHCSAWTHSHSGTILRQPKSPRIVKLHVYPSLFWQCVAPLTGSVPGVGAATRSGLGASTGLEPPIDNPFSDPSADTGSWFLGPGNHNGPIV